ncbi:hypothetical protein Tco_0024430 [Tanacetum coccineum]
MKTKDTLSSCLDSKEQQMQQMQDKVKGSCMVSFRLLNSHLKVLSNNDLKGIRTERGFKWAFAKLFDQDVQTFTGIIFLNVDQLEKQFNKEEFQENGSMAAFSYFLAYTQTEVQQFHDTLIQHMESVKKSIDERALHKREYDIRVNERQMQTKEGKVDTRKSLDVNSCAKVPSHKTTNRIKPVEKISIAKKPERQIPTRHRFSIKKTTTVHEKTMTPRSGLTWKPKGRIFTYVGLRCRNEMERGLSQMPVIMGMSHVLRDDSRSCMPRSLSWRESFDREGDHGSHGAIGERIPFELEGEAFEPERRVRHQAPTVECKRILVFLFTMSAKDSIAIQTCELSEEEFNEFLALYLIPPEYHVILPKSNQTIFDAPPGYVELYTHSFSLANLKLPLTEFFYKVLEYFQVHISRLNPFGCAKLTTFVGMCKPYGCEPTIKLFRGVRVFLDPILFLAGLQSSWEHGQERPAILVGVKGINPPNFFLRFSFWLIYDLPFLLAEMAFKNFIYAEDEWYVSDIQKRTQIQAKTDKTEHENGKSVKVKSQQVEDEAETE